ncbi:MFS transporter [Pseudolysinimonas kribbensis]|uniref:MFS transporter n=1 Tax=Pseudolysinimonas kribbensis TaxID=433641 RepID=A0ABQ6K9C4_9MICO|nr:MFS transporter [Pseudolysinimonas kribbensis]GMA96200.1 MFS transporter [Pseudolysinimonas kribbensis]
MSETRAQADKAAETATVGRGVAATGETAPTPTVDRGALRRVVVSGIFGGIIEWFDYFIYAQAAALVFPTIFFPNQSPIVGVLLSFGGFAVGQFARPIGALIFGNLGDKYGRKPVLVATFLLMGISTLLMGFLPTYAVVGVAAPILLTILRVAQGFGAGAEFAGASIIMLEYAPRNRRGLFGSVGTVGSSSGLMLGTLVFFLLQYMPHDDLIAWGWRIPFFFSAILVIVGLWIRYRVNESPLFQKVVEKELVQKVPLATVFRTEWRSLILVFCLAAGVQMGTYVFLTWILSYLNGVKSPAGALFFQPQESTFFVFLAGVCSVIGTPLWGLLSDKLGRKVVFGGAALLSAILVLPYFLLINTGNPVAAAFAVCLVGGGTIQMMAGVQGSLFGEVFSTKIRYSGFALGREISAAIFGGLSPLIATALVAASGGAFWGVAVYVAAVCILTFVAVLFARETHKQELRL